MAFPRHTGKFLVIPPLCFLAAFLTFSAWAPIAAKAGGLAAVVSDYHTGLAMSGYDPVAYFAEAKPVPGRAELEISDGRGVFRFRNEGNRDAFVAHPEVYAPQFSGYDPLALARGIALAGNPLEWEIVGDRLYFFYSPQARAAFMRDPAQAIAIAAQRWPGVAEGIVR
jgi:hypothetical protein